MTLSFFLLTLALSTPVLKTHGSRLREKPTLYDGISPSEFLNGHLGKSGVLKHSPEYYSMLTKTVEDLRGVIEDAGSELIDVHDKISDLVDEIVKDLPDEKEDLEDIIDGAIDNLDDGSDGSLHFPHFPDRIKDEEGEIDDAYGETDYLPDVIDEDMINLVENLRNKLEESESETDDFDDKIDDFPEFPQVPDGTKDIEDMDNETIINSNEFAREDEELEANSRAKRFAELFDPLGFLRRQKGSKSELGNSMELEKINVKKVDKQYRVFITFAMPTETIQKIEKDAIEQLERQQEAFDALFHAEMAAIQQYERRELELVAKYSELKLQNEQCMTKGRLSHEESEPLIEMNKELIFACGELTKRHKQLIKNDVQIEELRKQLIEKDGEIKELSEKLVQKDNLIKDCDDVIVGFVEERQRLDGQLIEKDAQIKELKEAMNASERAVQETGDISPSLKEDRTVEENNESANENLVEVETQPDDTS
jgi:DNA repair exonuclease SbcCD ATPase subunit